MRNFPIGRLGNKQLDIKYFERYFPDKKDLDTVAEAFAGSFAVIRNNFYDVENIMCADSDTTFTNKLKNILENLEDYRDEKLKILEYMKQNNTGTKDDKNFYLDNDKMTDYIKTLKYLDKSDLRQRGIWKIQGTTIDINKYKEIAGLYKKIVWFDDYKKVFDKVVDNPKAFVFLDPPYFSSHNKDYNNKEQSRDENKIIQDTTFIYIDILEFIEKAKCKVMLIVNNSAIIRYLYNKFYKGEYIKQYQLSKSFETLNIYCNY